LVLGSCFLHRRTGLLFCHDGKHHPLSNFGRTWLLLPDGSLLGLRGRNCGCWKLATPRLPAPLSGAPGWPHAYAARALCPGAALLSSAALERRATSRAPAGAPSARAARVARRPALGNDTLKSELVAMVEQGPPSGKLECLRKCVCDWRHKRTRSRLRSDSDKPRTSTPSWCSRSKARNTSNPSSGQRVCICCMSR
jgi:hypothetical protein